MSPDPTGLRAARTPSLRGRLLVAAVAALAVFAALLGTVRADAIERTVGPYALRVAYETVPPHSEEMNALQIEVRESATGRPVTGLESSLSLRATATVGRVSGDWEVQLVPDLEHPGRYRGVMVPPIPGEYTFFLTGEVEGRPIDEQFLSGAGGLEPVTARTGFDYSGTGAKLAVVILVAYLVGLGILLAVMFHRRRKGASAPV